MLLANILLPRGNCKATADRISLNTDYENKPLWIVESDLEALLIK